MKKYLLLFLILFNYSYADDKILYIDINFLLKESDSGKYISNELQKINNKNIAEFKKIEESIKLEENKILKQKNILKEEDYNKKINDLREKYQSYQKLKNKKTNELKKVRNEAGNNVLKIINDILEKYSTDNSVSLIINKQNIIIGKTELDITKDILILLNEKIKKVELKYE